MHYRIRLVCGNLYLSHRIYIWWEVVLWLIELSQPKKKKKFKLCNLQFNPIIRFMSTKWCYIHEDKTSVWRHTHTRVCVCVYIYICVCVCVCVFPHTSFIFGNITYERKRDGRLGKSDKMWKKDRLKHDRFKVIFRRKSFWQRIQKHFVFISGVSIYPLFHLYIGISECQQL